MTTLQWITAAYVVVVGFGALACETMEPGTPGNLVPPTVAEDGSLPAVALNGSRFHLETFGSAANPVIVFLHGGPGGDYRSLLRLAQRHNGYSLADDYFLVFWDQRSAGLSARHDKGDLTIDVYRADLHAVVERYSPGRPVILIGVSWGGMFATDYINRNPQRVAGAVLIEPGPLDGATMERLKDDLTEFDLGSELLNDIAWNSQFFSADDHARMDFARALGVRDGQPRSHLSTADPEPSWRLGAAASRYIMEDGQDAHGVFNYDFTANLTAFTRPVLFIVGAWSEVLGASLQQAQVQRYPAASLQVVAGAGHDVAWVKAADVLSQVRTYLNSLNGGSR